MTMAQAQHAALGSVARLICRDSRLHIPNDQELVLPARETFDMANTCCQRISKLIIDTHRIR